ncbi:MAG: BppU family phage baseplate upper protein [Leuconostoc sp.]|nr:BppU family phage baseplate upper protein [Leuconostoc sp.]
MPVLKKGEIKVRATAYGTEVKSTGYVFYSYDKKASALFFQFRNQNGETTDIGNAKIRLLLIKNDDEEKEFIPSQEDFEIISKPGGTAKFVLPEMLLAYQGKVTGYVYLEFNDGSTTDEGQFTFRIRRSMITHVLPAMGDKYVQDFEDIKERVEQAEDSARNDFKDSVESTGKAETKAKNDMQDSVDQVNKDYQTWKAEQEEQQTTFESDTNKTINGINTKVEETQTKVSDLEKNADDLATKQYVEEFNETITTQLAQKGNQEDLEKTNMNLEQVAKRVNVLDRLPENLTGLIANSIIAIPEKTIPLSWNAVDWELGSIATVSGAPITGTIRIRTPNFLTIEPNTKYATFLVTTDDGSNASESLIDYFFYKDDNTYIESTGWLSNNQSFTTPSETSKLKEVVRNVVDNVTITTEYITVAKPILSRVY